MVSSALWGAVVLSSVVALSGCKESDEPKPVPKGMADAPASETTEEEVPVKSSLNAKARYVAGNVIDVSTLPRTIAELKANGINTNFAILDAGYYTGKNADVLYEAGISFISRMKSNFKVYKRVVKNHLDTLETKSNLVRFNKRLVYVKCVPCHIGEKEDRKAYA